LPTGSGDNSRGQARDAAPFAATGCGRARHQEANEDRTRRIAVRLGTVWLVESGDEPLPLDDADSYPGRARFDESGAGGRGLSVRTRARTKKNAAEYRPPEESQDFRFVG